MNAVWAKVPVINMLNKMKILKNTFAALSAAVLLSCSGNVDDTSLPVLTANMEEVDLAKGDKVTFTVTYNGQDVTSEAVVSDALSAAPSRLPAPEFTPEEEGTYLFVAEYNGKLSNTVTVEVINTDVKIESRFDRHVLVAEFTGASCAFCPAGYDNMMLQFSKPAMASYKPNVHICAFHSEEMGQDSLAINATQDLKGMFAGLALPSYTIDLRDAGGLDSDGLAGFNTALKAAFKEHTPHCGVAVSSTLSDGGRSAEIQVKVASELTSQYRVVVLVVQDKIVGYQKHGTYGELNDYIHKHVVRQVVTTYTGTFTGEKLTDDGRIAAGTEVSKKWNVDVDRRWVLENTEIYAIVLDKDGYVNNMNVCHIDGGDSGYDLK